MSEVLLRLSNPASPTPVRFGAALGLTVGLFYALCTLVWLAAPGTFLGFMNSLFHGIDFSSLTRQAPFSWSGFIEALVVLSVWAGLAGMFFGWLRQRLGA